MTALMAEKDGCTEKEHFRFPVLFNMMLVVEEDPGIP
jgi:hypothetical protein